MVSKRAFLKKLNVSSTLSGIAIWLELAFFDMAVGALSHVSGSHRVADIKSAVVSFAKWCVGEKFFSNLARF